MTSGSPPVPEVWCEWFGAKGDCNGTSGNGTDCTASIQAAIDMAATYNYVSRGYKSGKVRIGKGIFRITDSIVIDQDRSGANAFGMHFLGNSGGSATISDTTIFWDGTTTTYTDVNVTAVAGNEITITSASASFAANVVGSIVYISGAATSGNNGAFPVTTRVSGTSIKLNYNYTDLSPGAADANNGSITIALPTKPAIKLWSQNCILKDFFKSPFALAGICFAELT